jgi:predicted ATPase
VLVRNGVVKLAKALDEIRVPPTVQAILASRIDRLPAAEKELLQTLAVLGREFPLGLIKRVAGKSDADLERMLSELQLAEFIYEQPAMGDIEYMFKHALTLEVAYNSVLIERRRLLHERAGQAMEGLFADRLEDHVAELAHHYDRSGNARKAVEYLGRAGARAAQQMAHSEAVGYFTKALELLKQLPEGADRDRNELDLQTALAQSLYVARGPAAQEREPALVRARELCEQLGDSARLMEALLAMAHFHSGRRESQKAQALAERVIVLAQAAGAPAMLGGAHAVLGLVLNGLGQFDGAQEHLQRALELFGGEAPYGPLGRSAFVVLSLVLFLLGYPTTALGKAREFLASARRLSDHYLIAYALFSDATLHALFGDSRTAMERGEELLSTATEHGFVMFQLQSGFVRGWALAGLGRTKEGITEILGAISVQPRSAPRTIPYFCPLAQAYGNSGHPEEGLAAVAEGLARVELSGERFAEAELHRVKGELLLMCEPRDEDGAERCFRTAIDIARSQKARFWELRATTSLARFLCKQGNRDDARQMLAEIYGWFTEGFDSSDLKDAKALLAELA